MLKEGIVPGEGAAQQGAGQYYTSHQVCLYLKALRNIFYSIFTIRTFPYVSGFLFLT